MRFLAEECSATWLAVDVAHVSEADSSVLINNWPLAMAWCSKCLLLLAACAPAASQLLAAFDTASVSSVYATDGFSAELATMPGSGARCLP